MPRQLVQPKKGDKRFIRRDAEGHFTEKQVDVGRSLAVDRRAKSKTVVKKAKAIEAIRSIDRPAVRVGAVPGTRQSFREVGENDDKLQRSCCRTRV